MRILIDIDENLYTRLFDNGVDNYDDAVDMAKAIRKCTPLPEHHGGLISEEDMLSVILFSKLFDSAKVGEVKEVLLKIPKIIEANKAESEE